jgi:hypothetical protein
MIFFKASFYFGLVLALALGISAMALTFAAERPLDPVAEGRLESLLASSAPAPHAFFSPTAPAPGL